MPALSVLLHCLHHRTLSLPFVSLSFKIFAPLLRKLNNASGLENENTITIGDGIAGRSQIFFVLSWPWNPGGRG
jgi:hypothetical protein